MHSMSMQYFDNKLYVVGNSGLAVVDVSEGAIEKAQNKILPRVKNIKVSNADLKEVDSLVLEEAKSTDKGVVLTCVREGAELRVKVLTNGYDKKLNCQFPKNLRKEGKLFLVDKVERSHGGKFYRVAGNIKTL